ncbi:phosphoglycerate mutase-like protein [Ascobolus immersus RN42]|uniref:Phosphoglycerate mutase-like protein n=1 Tax=Ascobolus immersus RN42 TaxID=1160509 RepID=A0A3N4HNQ1_ASCIM|nr:phosphoglycerate mutase-like protein [Ascobolus immersus RN42]
MALLSGLTLFVIFSTFGSFSGSSTQASSLPTPTRPGPGKTTFYSGINFTVVPGFFKQEAEETDPNEFDWISENFGLVFKTPSGTPDWPKFKREVARLNNKAARNERYKVLFLARHGQGHHNVAESFYGTALWDCFYSLLDGNETARWDDALLTKQGEAEARKAAASWKTQRKFGIPLPETYLSSPLRRAASTLLLTFTPNIPNLRPIFIENLRETLGAHTCDRRHSKADLALLYPTFTFEKWFFPDAVRPLSNPLVRDDPLWNPLLRETEPQKQQRVKDALYEIFGFKLDRNGRNLLSIRDWELPKGETYVSVTAHSGLIASALRVLGHRPFRLPTGGMIPVVVKATFGQEQEPRLPLESDVVKPCIAPPPE